MDRTELTDTTRLRRVLREAHLDGILATAPENVTHTSGYYNLDQRLLWSEFLHGCFWPVEGDPVLVLPNMERKLESFIKDVRIYRTYAGGPGSPETMLAEAIKDRRADRGRIGIDLRGIPASSYEQLKRLLPSASFVDAGEVFERLRNVKTRAEIEILTKAAAATDKAIAVGYREASCGDTEKKIVDSIDYHTLKYGAETVAFNIIASGPRILHGHHRAEEIAVQAGDVVRVDYGGLFKGYFTDLARMAVVGEPSERQRSIYGRCIEIQIACIEACKPGVTGAEIYRLACELYEKANLQLTRSMFGHSIGLHVHERPFFAANEPMPLEPSMVVCVENGWNDVEHNERYHIEDMLLVTPSRAEVLSDESDRSSMQVIS
jgi:Xaa-Pro aminopeptidase